MRLRFTLKRWRASPVLTYVGLGVSILGWTVTQAVYDHQSRQCDGLVSSLNRSETKNNFALMDLNALRIRFELIDRGGNTFVEIRDKVGKALVKSEQKIANEVEEIRNLIIETDAVCTKAEQYIWLPPLMIVLLGLLAGLISISGEPKRA